MARQYEMLVAEGASAKEAYEAVSAECAKVLKVVKRQQLIMAQQVTCFAPGCRTRGFGWRGRTLPSPRCMVQGCTTEPCPPGGHTRSLQVFGAIG